MRITSRFSCAAMGGFMSIPMMAHEMSWYYPNGELDMGRVRSELSEHPTFTLSSDDNRAVYAFAIEFLDRVRIMMDRFMSTHKGIRLSDGTQPKTSAEKRFEKGRFTFVRVDIRIRMSDGSFRIKLEAANPKNVVGNAEEFARIIAQAYADNLLELKDEFEKEKVKVELVEGEGCKGIFARSRERNERLRILEEHKDCKNRIGGQCSPCNFNCELFANGRCRYEEIANNKE